MPNEQLVVIREVLRRMMKAAAVDDPTQLAKKANLAHTTLTRIMSADAESNLTWTLSAKTWMKLSEASGVAVTFLGDEIMIPSQEPRDGDIVQKQIPARLLRFWAMLGPEEQDLVVSFVDAWAERVLALRKNE